jgi:hypothetical protein
MENPIDYADDVWIFLDVMDQIPSFDWSFVDDLNIITGIEDLAGLIKRN